MLDRDPRRLAAWTAAALVLVLLTVWYFARSRPAANAVPAPVATIAVAGAESHGSLTVDVSGAVKRPGVYVLAADKRVEDALERAGGPTRRADLTQVNRAAKLEDGRQILVPSRAPAATAGAGAAAAGGGGGASSGGLGTVGAAGAPVNINTATLEQLQTLDGVGPATAQKILDYRSEHGGFRNVEELDQVSGIGEKRLAALRERVRV